MSAFDQNDKTIHIRHPKWDAHESVEIRCVPTLEDDEWVNDQTVKLTQDKKGGEGALDIDSHLGSVQRLWIERMVVSWTFTKGGHPVAVSSKAIKQLPKHYSDYIYKEITKVSPSLSDEEEDKLMEEFRSVYHGALKKDAPLSEEAFRTIMEADLMPLFRRVLRVQESAA